MTEDEFWHSIPRKLYALMDVHLELRGGEKKEKPILGFIDEVL